MNTNKENKSNESQNKVIAEVPRSEKNVYRVRLWKDDKEGVQYRIVQRYFESKDGKSFVASDDMIKLREDACPQVAAFMMAAKAAPELPKPEEGKEPFTQGSSQMVEIPGKNFYGIKKTRGKDNQAVRVQFFFTAEETDELRTGKGKCGISILDSAVPAIVEALLSPLPEMAAETVAA